MTEVNVQQINEVAGGVVANVLEQYEDGLLAEEELLGDLFGKLVAAHALGWDIGTMSEEAKLAGDRLIEAIETTSVEQE